MAFPRSSHLPAFPQSSRLPASSRSLVCPSTPGGVDLCFPRGGLPNQRSYGERCSFCDSPDHPFYYLPSLLSGVCPIVSQYLHQGKISWFSIGRVGLPDGQELSELNDYDGKTMRELVDRWWTLTTEIQLLETKVDALRKTRQTASPNDRVEIPQTTTSPPPLARQIAPVSLPQRQAPTIFARSRRQLNPAIRPFTQVSRNNAQPETRAEHQTRASSPRIPQQSRVQYGVPIGPAPSDWKPRSSSAVHISPMFPNPVNCTRDVESSVSSNRSNDENDKDDFDSVLSDYSGDNANGESKDILDLYFESKTSADELCDFPVLTATPVIVDPWAKYRWPEDEYEEGSYPDNPLPHGPMVASNATLSSSQDCSIPSSPVVSSSSFISESRSSRVSSLHFLPCSSSGYFIYSASVRFPSSLPESICVAFVFSLFASLITFPSTDV
jgi:hypothetical protein